MPAPSTCVITGTLYDAGGAPLPNTVVTFLMPQQVIGGATVSQSIISTITDSLGALSPVALPQTAIVFVTIAAGIMVRGIVPAAATGDIAALLAGTVFSGTLAGATVQANGVNLQSQLLLNFINGNGVTVTNPSGGILRFDSDLYDKNNTSVTVISTNVETQLFSKLLGATDMGTMRRLTWVGFGLFSIINANQINLNFNWAGVGNVITHQLFGGTTTTRTTIPYRWTVEVYMNGAVNSWRAISELTVASVEVSGGTDHPGFGTINGPTTDIRIADSGSTDLSIARTFQITAAPTVSSSSNSFTYRQSKMYLEG